jgi:HK97 family phage major capsid protein
MRLEKRQERLAEIRESVNQKLAQVNAIHDGADKRGELETATERESIISLNREIEELQKEGTDLREILSFRGRQSGQIPFEGSSDERPAITRGGLGRAFTEAPLYRQWMEGDEKRGRTLASSTPWQSPEIRVGTFFREYQRDIVSGASDALGGAFVPVDRKPEIGFGYAKELTIFDLITMGETGSNNVEFMRIDSVTNNAAPTAQASATGDGSGAAPESAMSFSRQQSAVKDITHWVPVTNNLLLDAAQTRTEIDNFLTYGVRQAAQNQILNGSGGDGFTGIFNTSGIGSQAWDTNILTTTRKARTKVRTEGRKTPNAYVLNPIDWETIDLGQDNEARYYYGGPAALGQKRLWGLPVVECEDATQGVGGVADWMQAILWDRMESAIFVSNSHSDFFTRRITALLGVYRAAFGVKWPAAFIEIDLTA